MAKLGARFMFGCVKCRQSRRLAKTSKNPLYKDGYNLKDDQTLCPATISSWLKQTISLYNAQAGPKCLTTLQIKAHDVRPLPPPGPFMVGYRIKR